MDGTLLNKKYKLDERVTALEEGGGGGGLPDYSTDEQATGQKWIDGKDIYFKTFDCGALPNTNIKEVSSGLTNVRVIKFDGFAESPTDSLVIPLGYMGDIGIYYNYSANTVSLTSKSDLSVYTSSYVVIYYTKNDATTRRSARKKA